MIHDVPENSTVVGNPGHPVRVDGRKPEGPDADWAHLPDPVADAIKGLADRLDALEGWWPSRPASPTRAPRCGRCGAAAAATRRGASRGAQRDR